MMNKTDRLSLDHMERVLGQIEQNLGLNNDGSSCGKKVTGEDVYQLARSLFYSVPVSQDQNDWTDEQKDQLFEEKYLGCSKRHFVATMDARLRRAARQRAREQQLKRGKR